MIPEGWKHVTLADVATVRRGAGSQYLTYVDRPEQGLRLIRIGDFLADDKVYVEHTRHIDRFILSKGDILIAGTGATAGIVFEIPDEFDGLAFSYNAPLIQVSSSASKKYIFKVLSSQIVIQQQKALFTGNAQPFLDTKAISGFRIPLPPLPEQRRIAEILSTWDRAIETVEALIANARAQKKALVQSLLTGKHRLPGFSGEWAELSLRELATIHYGSSPKGIAVKGGKFPIIGTGGIVGTTNQVVCDSPAIIIGRKGTIDKPQLMSGGFWAIDTTYFCLPKQNVDLRWLFEQVQCFDFKALNEASGVPSLSRETLYAVRLLVPPIEEQSAIGELLAEAKRFECTRQNQLIALRQEKSALMQQLLTGKRRVRVDEREDA